jgi:predicted RNA binding protein with dsRBD fold (UPF0201 family)
MKSSALIPEEEISDEERLEIHKIREETKRGEKFRLDDVLTELKILETYREIFFKRFSSKAILDSREIPLRLSRGVTDY